MKQYTVKVFDNRTEWFNQKDQLHRDGGLPAIEWADGTKEYYVNGKLHRDGGLPAIEWANGDKEYWINGKLHRDGGLPAIEWHEYKSYWINGKQVTKEQAEKLAKPTCAGKVVEIDGRKYQLKEIK